MQGSATCFSQTVAEYGTEFQHFKQDLRKVRKNEWDREEPSAHTQNPGNHQRLISHGHRSCFNSLNMQRTLKMDHLLLSEDVPHPPHHISLNVWRAFLEIQCQ